MLGILGRRVDVSVVHSSYHAWGTGLELDSSIRLLVFLSGILVGKDDVSKTLPYFMHTCYVSTHTSPLHSLHSRPSKSSTKWSWGTSPSTMSRCVRDYYGPGLQCCVCLCSSLYLKDGRYASINTGLDLFDRFLVGTRKWGKEDGWKSDKPVPLCRHPTHAHKLHYA